MEEYLRVRSLLDGAYGRSLHSTDGSGFVKVWVVRVGCVGGVGVGVGLERATHGTVLMSIWNELDLGANRWRRLDGEGSIHNIGVYHYVY